MKLSAFLAFSFATAFAAVRTEGIYAQRFPPQWCSWTAISNIICLFAGCPESAVRLEGLGSREVGRVQICEGGEWRDACSSSGRWRESNAVVVCRELGFSNGAVVTTTDR